MGRFCQAMLRNLEYRGINDKPLNGFKEGNVESDLYYKMIVLTTVCREDWRGQGKNHEIG